MKGIYYNSSIRKKILLVILVFSLLLVGSTTMITVLISRSTLKDQLIYNRKMSIGWLQDRLGLETKDYINQFYNFEVNKGIKNVIMDWCKTGKSLDYTSKLQLITAMNTVISMDSNINSIEIFNLKTNQVLVAKRSGADMQAAGDKLKFWKDREKSLQTNIVFKREGKEIMIAHQVYDFYENVPVALITIKIRPYEIQDILENIKTTEDESVMLFNDEQELIEADYSKSDSKIQTADLAKVIEKFAKGKEQEFYYKDNFWFYRSVNRGKLIILFAVPSFVITNAMRQMLIAGSIISGIAVIISIGGSVLFSGIFSKPIIALAEKMKTAMINNYSEEIPSDRKDEIGILQNSFNLMMERNQRLIKQEYQSKIEKREAQVRALQAQINPHFMHNTLQTIGGIALEKNVTKIYDMTTSLSDIMRYSLSFTREMVCIREEIRYLQEYLNIQNERFDNRIEFEVQVKKELMEYVVPKLILQPILENSLGHGLINKTGTWKIQLKAMLTEEDDLLLEISDNGIGLSQERLAQIREILRGDAGNALKTSSHIGLGNVHSRIRLKYPDTKYGVTIESQTGEGTTVRILTKAVKENRKYDIGESSDY
ncbi:sensor histidine kinase [Anaerocolumna xylanovorans]|uniref:Histidine kinase-, DNA gyrase B-, and HSP90-like ATPase n=1 Tax=Anaerocolumna xylanovorans DSM 12503 TaxID=1121345 RepID=A0A1M7YFS6_9FIRM|nr:sensor histidine kinase [Anaerocolumna xylanovorans]SHO51507.1 Histidine kinase-, DNA gyrase B-, and HSP90-like ATPase [Anaerocolumna xylanovorans DSM 12503]